MRWILAFTAVVIATGLTAPAVADDKGGCLNNKDYDARIKSCSEILRANPSDAIAYHNRGTAHQLKGDLDHAIADFDKANELQPKNASAYNSRGLVYATKGDYVHALADVTRAQELTPKTTPKPKAMAAPNPKTKPTAQAPPPPKEAVSSGVPEADTKWIPWSKSP